MGPQSTLGKSLEELTTLRAAGLTKAYLGVETDDDQVLKEINKMVDAAGMLIAGRRLVEAGINLSAMVLLGIAGKGRRSHEHAIATAKIINRMQPHYLAALNCYTDSPYTAVQPGERRKIRTSRSVRDVGRNADAL